MEMHGYDTYNYGERYCLSTAMVLMSIEKYHSISPYAYCMNNPVNRIDPDGRDWYEDEFGSVYWHAGSDEVRDIRISELAIQLK